MVPIDPDISLLDQVSVFLLHTKQINLSILKLYIFCARRLHIRLCFSDNDCKVINNPTLVINTKSLFQLTRT